MKRFLQLCEGFLWIYLQWKFFKVHLKGFHLVIWYFANFGKSCSCLFDPFGLVGCGWKLTPISMHLARFIIPFWRFHRFMVFLSPNCQPTLTSTNFSFLKHQFHPITLEVLPLYLIKPQKSWGVLKSQTYTLVDIAENDNFNNLQRNELKSLFWNWFFRPLRNINKSFVFLVNDAVLCTLEVIDIERQRF